MSFVGVDLMVRLPDFQRVWEMIFNPKTIVPFLFGSTALGVLSNSVYGIITYRIGVTPGRLTLVVVATVAVLVGSLWVVAHFLRPRTTDWKFYPRKPAKRRGLVFLVSQEVPCRKAAEYHKDMLETCWLICSTSTLPMAQGLSAEFKSQNVSVPDPIVINNVNDPVEFRDAVLKIYNSLPDGWKKSDIITDYLGMTSHATAGVILAWSQLEFPLEYTLPTFDAQRKPIGAGDPIEIALGSAEPRQLEGATA
jgi:hypothetical protein